MLLGNDYLLYIKTQNEWKVLACLKSNGFAIDVEDIDVVTRCSGKWGSGIPVSLRWSMEAEGDAIDIDANDSRASYEALFDLATNMEIFRARIMRVAEGDVTYVREGDVYIKNYREIQDVNAPFSFSSKFISTGEVKNKLSVWSQDGSNIITTDGKLIIV